MHITFISHRYFPEPTADSVRIASMVRSACNRGHIINVISNRNSMAQGTETLIQTRCCPPPNTQSIYKRSMGEILLGINIVWKILWHKTDVYVITSPCYITALITWFFTWIRGKKYICDIRDNYPDALIYTNSIHKKHPISRISYALNAFIFKRALGVSYVVPNDKKFAKQYNISPIVVSNGFDMYQTTLHNKPKDSFNIIFHGNFGRMYDMQMFNAVAEGLQQTVPHKKITVTVMGCGINADTFNTNYITVLPPIASHTVYKTLEKYHMGMLFLTHNPSNNTCFPVKAFEYFGQNIPVLINSKNLCATYIKTHQTGIIADTVSDAIHHIQHIYENQTAYDTIVENIKNTKHLLSREYQNENLLQYLETHIKEPS